MGLRGNFSQLTRRKEREVMVGYNSVIDSSLSAGSKAKITTQLVLWRSIFSFFATTVIYICIRFYLYNKSNFSRIFIASYF